MFSKRQNERLAKIAFQCSADEKERLQKYADEERRSLSNYMREVAIEKLASIN